VLAKGLDASDDPQQPWDAATALEWLRATDGLAAFLGKRKADPNAVIHAAGVILRVGAGAADAELAKRTLLTGLGLRKLPLRGLAVQELATGGGAWALEPLRKLRSSRKGKGLEVEIAEAIAKIEERARP
jgi:hypothetical protein